MAATDWAPERKIVAAAIAGVIMWLAQLALPGLVIPPGIESAVVVIVGYMIPNP